MTLETKYNIGDTIWFHDHGQPLSREIIMIEVRVCKKRTLVKYSISEDGIPVEIYEQDAFSTKEELLKSL